MRYGGREIDDTYVQTSILPRLVSNVEREGECLVWTGGLGRGGYSKMAIKDTEGKTINARPHRLVAILFFGDIGCQEVDHTCRNRRCIRADHLEPVEGVENIRRMHRRIRSDKYKDQVKMPWGEDNGQES